MFSSGPPEYNPEMAGQSQQNHIAAPSPSPMRPTLVPHSEFMLGANEANAASASAALEPSPPPTHFMQSPANRELSSPSRPSTSRQRPEKKDSDGPYYRASKPWHRQDWQDGPNTPLNKHIQNVMLQKLLEHSGRNTCAVWSPLWTKARMCKHWVCVECEEIPFQPVATACGHTMCRACAMRTYMCQCQTPLPRPLAINLAIRAVVEELAPQDEYLRQRIGYTDLSELDEYAEAAGAAEAAAAAAPPESPSPGPYDEPRPSTSSGLSEGMHQFYGRPMSPSVGASSSSDVSSGVGPPSSCSSGGSCGMPNQAVWNAEVNVGEASQVLKKQHKNVLVRNLRGLIRGSDARRLIQQLQDLTCVLCSSPFRRPVTTPCGHTYCRSCLERSLDYSLTCPLCCQSLFCFNVDSAEETVFLSRFLEVAEYQQEEEVEMMEDDDRIPIFVCTVAYPMVPCPLFVFEPRYRLMIRRCLRSGSRRFGIVGSHPITGYVNYGTILEVRDSVRLADGRHIISTMGISRFRIIERGVRDGYDVARVERLQDDLTSHYTHHRSGGRYGHARRIIHIRMRAEAWLRSMDYEARAEVEMTFGTMPPPDHGGWSPDGPAWLWWVLALLPLDNNLKLMILSNPDVRKRMAVVERTLEIMAMFAGPSPGGRQPGPPPNGLRTTPNLFDTCLQRAA